VYNLYMSTSESKNTSVYTWNEEIFELAKKVGKDIIANEDNDGNRETVGDSSR